MRARRTRTSSKGFCGVVQAGDDLALRVAGDRREALVLGQLGEELGRADVREGVHVAGLAGPRPAPAGPAMKRNVTLSSATGASPHQAALRTSSTLSPRAHALNLNGPVPIGVARLVSARLRRHDRGVAPRQVVEEVAGDLLQPDHGGRGVGRLDGLDRGEDLLLRVGGLSASGPGRRRTSRPPTSWACRRGSSRSAAARTCRSARPARPSSSGRAAARPGRSGRASRAPRTGSPRSPRGWRPAPRSSGRAPSARPPGRGSAWSWRPRRSP